MHQALCQLIDGLEHGEELPRLLEAGALPARLGPLHPVVTALIERPWPMLRESLLNLLHLGERVGDAGPWPTTSATAQNLAAVLSGGPELGRMLVRRPARLAYLLDPTLGRPWSAAELAAELEQIVGEQVEDDEQLAERLATFRNDQFVRLAACEFGAGSLEQVGAELALVADLALDRALRHVIETLARSHGEPVCQLPEEPGRVVPCKLAALAMGKYGAQELNFCSDIDVVFIYTADEGQAGSLTLHEFFARACQRVARILSQPNSEGYVFRVDLRLRPEGSRGPICNSLAGAERYYETWGGPYDRLAWLKARPAAGDLTLGEEMLRLLRPFVFPRSTRPEVVEHIQELYRRLSASMPAANEGWDVKLGAGGIRAVEFFVQALQLVHAGKRETLQERSTLRALDKLLFGGLISEREHSQLAEAYDLWRHIEHRLQLREGRQTHRVPARGAVREWLAGHLGLGEGQFEQTVAAHRARVQAIYRTLDGESETAKLAPADEVLAPLLDEELGREQRTALLAQAGFEQPAQASEELELLLALPWGPLARRGSLPERLALGLLAELAASPDPNAALHHVVALTLRLGPHHGLWQLLEQHRLTLRLLCSLFGSSDYLARLFIQHPELLDQLLLSGQSRRVRSLTELRTELAARLNALEEQDIEGRLNALRRFRNEEVLRVGLHDIAGDLEAEQVWTELSHLAQAVLEQTYPLVHGEAMARYGTPRAEDGTPASMVVLGLGKLGAGELTYASDLDLIFVYSARGVTDGKRSVDNGEFFARVAQRLIGALGSTMEDGRLYDVDTRLRPSGQQGTLVTSFAAFQHYQQHNAQLWERQVLIKVRPVAGDLALGAQVQQGIEGYVYQELVDVALLRSEMRRHRTRIEKELAGENGDFYNLKRGRGGLLDIDFIVQYYQLAYGGVVPALRVGPTLQALAALAAQGVLARELAETLARGYRFLRRVEGRLRIVRDRPAERLPRAVEGLEVMARRLGYRAQAGVTAGGQLLEDYQQLTESIRGIYSGIFAPADA